MASAGCVGLLCAFLSEEELRTVLQQNVLGKLTCTHKQKMFHIMQPESFPVCTCYTCGHLKCFFCVNNMVAMFVTCFEKSSIPLKNIFAFLLHVILSCSRIEMVI